MTNESVEMLYPALLELTEARCARRYRMSFAAYITVQIMPPPTLSSSQAGHDADQDRCSIAFGISVGLTACMGGGGGVWYGAFVCLFLKNFHHAYKVQSI
jgi:hypothetical protein